MRKGVRSTWCEKCDPNARAACKVAGVGRLDRQETTRTPNLGKDDSVRRCEKGRTITSSSTHLNAGQVMGVRDQMLDVNLQKENAVTREREKMRADFSSSLLQWRFRLIYVAAATEVNE